MSKKWLFAGGGALFAIYVAGAPYITAHQMKSAAECRDGEALSEHIEFPSVRQSLKDQMNAMVMKEMSKEMADNPFAAMGVVFAGTMVDKMVDAYVTPIGITQMMAGEKPNTAIGGESDGSPARNPTSLLNASMSYVSLNKFVLTVKDDSGEESRFILRRRVLGWKMTEIDLALYRPIDG